jgi:hypothetical protein
VIGPDEVEEFRIGVVARVTGSVVDALARMRQRDERSGRSRKDIGAGETPAPAVGLEMSTPFDWTARRRRRGCGRGT